VSRARIEKDQDDVIGSPRFRLRKAAKCSDGFDDPIEFFRFFNSGSSQINATAFWLCPSRWPRANNLSRDCGRGSAISPVLPVFAG
jgi:hypothetical protein